MRAAGVAPLDGTGIVCEGLHNLIPFVVPLRLVVAWSSDICVRQTYVQPSLAVKDLPKLQQNTVLSAIMEGWV